MSAEKNVLSALSTLAREVKVWATELGFAELRIAPARLAHAEAPFLAWLAQHYHGEMDYMASHGTKRIHPEELLPGTLRVLTARMDYLPANTAPEWRSRNGRALPSRARRRLRYMHADATITKSCAIACSNLAKKSTSA